MYNYMLISIYCIDINSDELILASGSKDGIVNIWDITQAIFLKDDPNSQIGSSSSIEDEEEEEDTLYYHIIHFIDIEIV